MAGHRGVPGGSQETRRELLETARKLLLDQGLAPGFPIKVSDVVTQAGRSLGAAYQIWENQDAFRRDLAAYVAESVSYADVQLIEPLVAELLARGEPLEAIVRSAATQYFSTFAQGPEFYVQLHFWTVLSGLPEQVEKAVGASYERIQESFERFFTATLAAGGLQARSPFTMARITTMVTALTEGLALRHRFAPTTDDAAALVELYADSLIALITAATEPAT